MAQVFHPTPSHSGHSGSARCERGTFDGISIGRVRPPTTTVAVFVGATNDDVFAVLRVEPEDTHVAAALRARGAVFAFETLLFGTSRHGACVVTVLAPVSETTVFSVDVDNRFGHVFSLHHEGLHVQH